MPSFYREGPPDPPYLQGLIGDLAERTERTSFQRPQDYATLRSIYDKSQGTAPDLLSGVGSSAIAALFTEAIRASQQMGRERGGARAGERGVAPGAARTTGLSSGVQAQQLASAMRPLQERIAGFQLMDALELMRAKREATEKGLAALFAAASGPVSEDRYTSYKTRPARDTMPEVRYPSQPGGGGGLRRALGGGDGGGDGGGGTSSDGWWRGKSLGWSPPGVGDTAGGGGSDWGKSIGGLPGEPSGGGAGSYSLPGASQPSERWWTGGGLGGPGVWGDDEPGDFPGQPTGPEEPGGGDLYGWTPGTSMDVITAAAKKGVFGDIRRR